MPRGTGLRWQVPDWHETRRAPSMDPELLIERVQRWSGISTEPEAERAIVATLRALREALFDDEAAALAQALPERFAESMRIGAERTVVDAERLYHHAARFEEVPVRVALEHVQAVCQALASLLRPPVVTRLSQALPNLAQLFVVPDRAPHPAVGLSRDARTLAEGRPGSEHPLGEARPGSEHPLSEARPPALHARTIAEGRSGSEHPLSEARPSSEHPLSEARPRAPRR